MPSDERREAKLMLTLLRYMDEIEDISDEEMDEIEDMSDEELALALVRDIWSDMKTHTREAMLVAEAIQRLEPGLIAEELNDERHADF
jgi:hypothetical protein